MSKVHISNVAFENKKCEKVNENLTLYTTFLGRCA